MKFNSPLNAKLKTVFWRGLYWGLLLGETHGNAEKRGRYWWHGCKTEFAAYKSALEAAKTHRFNVVKIERCNEEYG